MNTQQIAELKQAVERLEVWEEAVKQLPAQVKSVRKDAPDLYLEILFGIREVSLKANPVLTDRINLPVVFQTLHNASPKEALKIMNAVEVTANSILVGYK